MAETNKVDPSLKKYLLEKNVAQILERFVAALAQSQPHDVVAFMNDWSASQLPKEKEEEEEETHQKEEESLPPASPTAYKKDVRLCWETYVTDPVAVAKAFFEILLTQHPSLGAVLFKDVDIDRVSQALAPLFTAAVEGVLGDATISQIIAKHVTAAHRVVQPYHLSYFITAGLMAVKVVVPVERWPAVAEPWRKFLANLMEKTQALLPAPPAANE